MSAGIGGATKIYGVIGDPVAHTLSPSIFNAAFKELKMDCVYLAFHVESPLLEKAVNGMRALDIAGLNVTIPHKVDVIRMLDEVDEESRSIGAVNTVLNENGRLKGFNTDVPGFLYALARAKGTFTGKKIVVLGAGGAARAVVHALAGYEGEIIILNRTPGKAEKLAESVQVRAGSRISALKLDHKNLSISLRKAGLLVNATSLGMSPNPDISPVPSELLSPGMTVADIVYNPLKTRLLAEAEAAGCNIVEGIHMLIGQAASAFEKWTGREAPVDLMTSTAMKELQK